MLFHRRQRRNPLPEAQPSDAGALHDRAQLYHIDFDMMLKGSIYQRRKGPVRQYGVTVNGSTRLVTSGDTVDFETYRALVAAGAVRPLPTAPVPKDLSKPGIIDNVTSESVED